MDRDRAKVIGIDFGTLSARAIVISVADGSVLGEATFTYPHGVITTSLPDGTPLPDGFALADPTDYRQALFTVIRQAAAQTRVEEIVGIGVAATSYTMVPCLEDASVACQREEFSHEPMAHIVLWKHHGAQDQARRILAVHRARGGFPVVERYGGVVNCEWAIPKILECREEAPHVFERVFRFCDLGEWLTWLLVGHPVSGWNSLGYKGMWAPDLGWPEDAALDALAPGFSAQLKARYYGEPPCPYGSACGVLSAAAAAQLGLPAGIAVTPPIGDGNAPGVCIGAQSPDSLIVTLGTSIAMAFLRKQLVPLTGINGVVRDGIVPGYYCYDAGQPCAGDMLDWFVTHQVPQSYRQAAGGAGIHTYLSLLAEAGRPWDNPLTVLDWWNGNRGILNDTALRGTVCGLSMGTRCEDLYGAMVQGMACGSRRIIDHCAAHGIGFDRIILCGGIARKNPFILRQYANLLGREVYLTSCGQVTALGAGILAAAAAGLSLREATTAMAPKDLTVTRPDGEHGEAYQRLYRRWCALHDRMADFPF